ncbi:MAG: alpha/beta fold hydrolase [Gammaproteobacteria bacterium]|nr:alpha/beta fold hydrolase [Gammaproteobacteria bacterium]
MQSQKSLLPFIEVNPTTAPIGTVILLHGLGADGNDFVPFVKELHLPANLPLRFVFPNAPTRPVTINNGYVMPAWYDILSMNIDQRADQTGLIESVHALNHLIENEIKLGTPADKIILAGFSQGAVVALTTALRHAERLAGVLVLSGYLPNAQELATDASSANRTTPIFMAHGTQDPVIPFNVGQAAFEVLKKAEFAISWHSYAMAHSVCEKEAQDIATWLKRIYLA